MRLSFYTYSYTDRLEMPLVPVLERIAATGYDGIDISGTHGKSDDPQSVSLELRELTRKTAERLKLKIEAVITHAELTQTLLAGKPLDLKGSVDLAVDVGAPVVTFHMGGAGNADPQDVWERSVAHLKDAARHAEQRHVKLAVDGIWPPWIVNTPQLLMKLFDDVASPSLGVNYDPCYLVLMGLDPAVVARLWKSRIVHAHLKDHAGRYPKWEHRIPGRGEMDYLPVVQALKAIGFTDSLAVEAFTDMKFETACDVGYSTVAAALQKGGVRD
ncbi:MAG: sugar phosphate isomerase/epimerase [Planctomycetes bacterium]|nr:sugar phosphate isomerase/epimerase [Planctomycetota bacterium]